jgi:hypothetical protein
VNERTIRVGGVNIGLVGLGAALIQVEALDPEGNLEPYQAAEQLLELLEPRNYIPEVAKPAYLEALSRLWRQRRGEEVAEPEAPLAIRILGPGCVSCNRLEEIVRSVLDRWKVAADIEHVHDLDEIWRYQVFQTPALVINDRVLCSGRVPTQAQMEVWIRDTIEGIRDTGGRA